MTNLEAIAKELEEHVKRTEELQKKFEEASKAEEEFKFPTEGYYFQQDTKQIDEYSSSSLSDPEDPELYATESLAEYYGKIIRKNMIIAQYVAQKAPDYRLDGLGNFEDVFFIGTNWEGKFIVKSYDKPFLAEHTEIYMPQSVAKQLAEDLNSGKINLEEL